MDYRQALAEAIKKLEKEKNKTPQLDAEVLLSHTLKKSREFILIHLEKRLTPKQLIKFEFFIKRRLKHEPIAYIIGQKEFYGLDFKINSATLIPRPETELLVENILKINPGNKTIIDLGTGSGNIIISFAKNLKNKNDYFGVDISQKALTIAKFNAKKNEVSNKIKFVQGNLLAPFIKNTKYDIQNTIIVANLPYLSKKIYSKTSPDVKNFEPKSALLSGIDGLDHYEKLFQQLHRLIRKLPTGEAGWKLEIFLEISPEQKQKIAKLIKKHFPDADIEFQKDLAKKWRVVIIKI
jgi:release factor glutamine methyltransferase